jgi:hypothetical protein
MVIFHAMFSVLTQVLLIGWCNLIIIGQVPLVIIVALSMIFKFDWNRFSRLTILSVTLLSKQCSAISFELNQIQIFT